MTEKLKKVLLVGVPAAAVAEPTSEENDFWRSYLALTYLKGANGIPKEKLVNLGNSSNIHYGIAALGRELNEIGYRTSYLAPTKEDNDATFIDKVVHSAKNVDVIGLSYHTCAELISRDIAKKIKERNPSAKILAGGPHCAGIDKVDARTPIDLYVRGRAHASLPFILDNLEKVLMEHKKDKIFRREETPKDYEIENLKFKFPIPNARLFNAKEIPGARVYTQIGCGKRNPCSFCGSLNNHRTKEFGNLERVFEYVDDLVNEKGTVYLYIGDEDFFMNPDHSLRVVEKLGKYKGKLTYSIQGRIETIRKSKIKNHPLLKRLGEQGMCTKIEMGVESASQKVLNMSQKGLRINHLEKVANLVHEQGIDVGTYWLGGLPGETKETYEYTTNEICRLLSKGIIDFAESTQVVPFPGTPLFNEKEKFVAKGVTINIHAPKEIGGNSKLKDCQIDRWRGENKPVFDLSYQNGENLSRDQMRDLYIKRIGKMDCAIKQRIEREYGKKALNKLMNPMGVDPLKVMSGF